MRFFKLILIVIALFTLPTACTRVDSPDTVVLKFYEAVSRMDFETVKLYVAKEFVPTFDILAHMAGKDLFEVPNEGNDVNAVIKSVEISKDENTATVVVEMVDSVGNVVDEETVPLVKEEGEWKIVIKEV